MSSKAADLGLEIIRNKARKLSGMLILFPREGQLVRTSHLLHCTAERLGMGDFGGPSFASRLGVASAPLVARRGSLGSLSDPPVHSRPLTPSPGGGGGGQEDGHAALQRNRPFLLRIPSPVPENAEALSDLTNRVARDGGSSASPKGAAGPTHTRRRTDVENAAAYDKTPCKQRPISDFLSVMPRTASRGAQKQRPSAADQSLLRQLGLESPSASTGPDGRSGKPLASPGAEQRPSGPGVDSLFEGLLKADSPGVGQREPVDASTMDTLSCTGSGLLKDTVPAAGVIPWRSLVVWRNYFNSLS